MGHRLELDSVERHRVYEELLEGSEVANGDLILEELHSSLDVSHGDVQDCVRRVLSQDCLVGILTRRGRHKDLRLWSVYRGAILAWSGVSRATLGVQLFVKAAQAVIIPLGFLYVYLLGGGCGLRAVGGLSRAQDIVYLLISGLELVAIKELLVSLFLVQELPLLEHLSGLLSLFGSQISHGPLGEVGLAVTDVNWPEGHKSL